MAGKGRILKLTITLPMTAEQAAPLIKAAPQHVAAGPDAVVITCKEPVTITEPLSGFTGQAPDGFEIRFTTTLTTGAEVGTYRGLISGSLLTIKRAIEPGMTPRKWRALHDKVHRRNAELLAAGERIQVPPDECD